MPTKAKARSVLKGLLTRAYGELEVTIEYDDTNDIVAARTRLKSLYARFLVSQTEYDDTLTDDTARLASEAYYDNVRKEYVSVLRNTKAALRELTSDHGDVTTDSIQGDSNESAVTIARLMNLPPLELPVFSGDSEEYDIFIATFKEVVERACTDPAARLIRLRSHVSGLAREAIKSCRPQGGETAYLRAMDILRERFGSPHIVCNSIIAKLKSGKPAHTPHELRALADDLASAEVTLTDNDTFSELDTQQNIVQICRRLRPQLRYKWRDRAVRSKQSSASYLKFSCFVGFVQEMADLANDPIYGADALTDVPAKSPHNSSASRSRGKVTVTGMSTSASTTGPSTSRSPDQPFRRSCSLCEESHKLFYCPKFKELPVASRIAHVKDNNLCDNCLIAGHTMSECRKPYICRVGGCNMKHSKLLHVDNVIPTVSTNYANYHNNVHVSMPIVSIIANDICYTHALLDTGSSSSFCTRRLIDKLNLKGSETSYRLRTLHGTTDCHTKTVDLRLSSEDGTESLLMKNVLVTDDIPVESAPPDVTRYTYLEGLSFHHPEGVDILIGQDNPQALVPLDVKKGPRHGPFATRTMFGWSLNGASGPSITSRRAIMNFVSIAALDDKVNKLWEINDEGITDDNVLSWEDKKVLAWWDSECRVEEGHYELPIPWRDPQQPMPDNLDAAQRRLRSLHASLVKKGTVSLYDEQVTRMVDSGYAEPVQDNSSEQKKCWYLPTHAVPKKDKKSLRLVFDCAHSYQGTSLNSSCYQGPNLTSKLADVLLRFRQYPHAVMADIRCMYNQVRIPLRDRDALRFLWVRDGVVTCYRSTSHLFGGVWCSSSASYALKKTAELTNNEVVQDMITQSFYVDDLAHSSSDPELLNHNILELKQVLSTRGFTLTKFIATNEALLAGISVDDYTSAMLTPTSKFASTALGIGWCDKQDVLFVKTEMKSATNKSEMLSSLASVYDPLGIVSPLLVRGRLLFQEAVRQKASWHEPFDLVLQREWDVWISTLRNIHTFVVPRCLVPELHDDSGIEMHCFNDASQQAYGCCIYLRCSDKYASIHTSLVASKSRICPLKGQTIPRLELQSAVLSAHFEQSVRSALTIELLPSTFWTDSRIALAYIQNESRRFNVFVGNRVAKIRRTTRPEQWNHIAGSNNPADVLTRPVTLDNIDHNLWLQGPAFLRTHKSQWEPPMNVDDSVLDQDPDGSIKRTTMVNVVSSRPHPLDVLIEHYSTWSKLVTAVAWILQVKTALMKNPQRKLVVSDLMYAKQVIIRHVQSQHFQDDISRINQGTNLLRTSKLKKLNPIFDEDGLLVVGGRLIHSGLTDGQKFPVVIPHQSPLATLIVRSAHERCHLGREWLFSVLRRTFWITHARKVIYQVSKNCVICKKLFAAASSQKMSDLPPERLQRAERPFTRLGVDVFGPFIVKHGRHEIKRYGCIFVCFNVRAVHLEMLNDLESDTFINALRRFIARRGAPSFIFSDNGTNFKGGQAELSKSMKQIDPKLVESFCIKQQIEWRFNTPTASHMAGVYERMIRTVRKVITGMLIDKCRLTDDVLRTFLCEAEAIVNSRPLTKMSDDPKDDLPLTPAHFLMIDDGPSVAPGQFTATDMYRRRWRYVQYLTDLFWRRYVNQYIPQLQARAKWLNPKPNFKVGDLVLLMGENTPRRLWPLGLIISVSDSRDGLVRSVRVRTKSTELVRPVTKIVSLEV